MGFRLERRRERSSCQPGRVRPPVSFFSIVFHRRAWVPHQDPPVRIPLRSALGAVGTSFSSPLQPDLGRARCGQMFAAFWSPQRRAQAARWSPGAGPGRGKVQQAGLLHAPAVAGYSGAGTRAEIEADGISSAALTTKSVKSSAYHLGQDGELVLHLGYLFLLPPRGPQFELCMLLIIGAPKLSRFTDILKS